MSSSDRQVEMEEAKGPTRGELEEFVEVDRRFRCKRDLYRYLSLTRKLPQKFVVKI